MKKATLLFCAFFIGGCATIEGPPSFFGIRMHHERAAKNLRVEAVEGKGYEFFYVPGAMDPGIKAEAKLEWHGRFASSLLMRVKNESDIVFLTDFTIDEFHLITKDGRDIELVKQTTLMNKDYRAIEAKKEVSYYLGIPVSEHLVKTDISQIICTFGADQVKVVLLPIPEKS